ncbi:MAG: magnesium transporter CorA family protein [Patescibacteria group bacterium]
MPVTTLTIHRLRWIHISSLAEADIAFLQKEFDFHPLDLKDCLEGVQRPKLDPYEKYLFMIFHFPEYDQETRRVGIRSLDVFLGKDFLVTITNEPDMFIEDYLVALRKKNHKGFPYDPLKNSAAYLLYKIIDGRYHKTLPVINEVGQYLNEVEEDVYSSRNKAATTNLAIIRRNVLNLRRIMEPQIKMVDRLVNMKNQAISSKLQVYFDDVHDYLENMWSALENYRDFVDSMYDTNESFINQRTNEVIKMLTVISVALLPMTLIASIYGMNVTGLPFADHPIGIWMIFGLMAGIVFGSIYLARRNNII